MPQPTTADRVELLLSGHPFGSITGLSYEPAPSKVSVGVDVAQEGYSVTVPMILKDLGGIFEMLDAWTTPRWPGGMPRSILGLWPLDAVAGLPRYWQRAAARARRRLGKAPTRGAAQPGGGEAQSAGNRVR